MTLATPPYIPEQFLQAMPIRHTWDDWDPYPALGMPDDDLTEALADVSDRAKKAFTIACSEWIVRRFGALSPDPLPLEYVEASWAALADWQIAYQWEPDSDQFKGPVRGPLDLAVRTITNCHNSLGLGGGEDDAAFASRVAVYVMPDPEPFLTWQKVAVERLQQLYPRDEDQPLGEPVPREALDPDVPLDELTPEHSAELFQAFLDGVEASKNRFIVPPAERE